MERWEEIRGEIINVYRGPDKEFTDPRMENLETAAKRIAELEEINSELSDALKDIAEDLESISGCTFEDSDGDMFLGWTEDARKAIAKAKAAIAKAKGKKS